MSDGRQPLDREAGFLSDADDELLDFQKSSKLSELYSATVPSIDSAMSSWDSSGFDAAYGSQGTYLHKASDLLLNPSDWRRSKHRSQTGSSSAGLVHHSALYDGRFTEDEWDKIPGFISPPRCNGTLNQDDSFWSQALRDLETCGQSEILRELEASMTGSALSLYLEETKTDEDSMFQPEISLIKKEGVPENQGNLNSLSGAREKLARGQGESADVLSTTSTTLALHKVTIRKDLESRDFGFSVSDGLLEKGVYVNMIRPHGPAEQAGLKPFDRILQVNHVRTRDLDCCLTVPLIIEAGQSLDLVISRNPPAATDASWAAVVHNPSDSLFRPLEDRMGGVAL